MNTEYGSEARNREEAARLLGMLISSSKRLVGPYVEPILKVVFFHRVPLLMLCACCLLMCFSVYLYVFA